MFVAVTGYAFKGCIENGGEGLKLGFFRSQAAKIAKKTTKQSTRGPDGKLKYNGPIVRRKGDCYLVDVAVMGSSNGTSEEPKFSLLTLFKDTLFPRIHELICPGGRFDGYLPVIQGDNAGPHQDTTFYRRMTSYCEDNRWLWRPQAPQMPYSNCLDLLVFPCMSKRHTKMLTEYSNSVAPPEEIERCAVKVWKELESHIVAQGYVLAFRVAQKVIETGGDNKFLRGGEYHANVRKDFVETNTGIRPKVTGRKRRQDSKDVATPKRTSARLKIEDNRI